MLNGLSFLVGDLLVSLSPGQNVCWSISRPSMGGAFLHNSTSNSVTFKLGQTPLICETEASEVYIGLIYLQRKGVMGNVC